LIGDRYWATGITVHADPEHMDRWTAEVVYVDDGLPGGDDNTDKGVISTEGRLYTRYAVRPGDTADALTAAIDVIKADAERIGVTWAKDATVCYIGAGRWDVFPPPARWRETVNAQAVRLGWRPAYSSHSERKD
jgi:hypothetical protein